VRAPAPTDSPVEAFVLMDATLAGRVHEQISASLADLQKVLRGQGMLTPTRRAEALALLAHEVPDTWIPDWPNAPEDPLALLQQLATKVIALRQTWTQRVEKKQLFAEPIALADFIRPTVFFNALRQQTARQLGEAIDGLHLVSSFDHAGCRRGPRAPSACSSRGSC